MHVLLWQVLRDNATSLDFGIFLVLACLANQYALTIMSSSEQDSASVTHQLHTQDSVLWLEMSKRVTGVKKRFMPQGAEYTSEE